MKEQTKQYVHTLLITFSLIVIFCLVAWSQKAFSQNCCDFDCGDPTEFYQNGCVGFNSGAYHYISTKGFEDWTLDGQPIPSGFYFVAVYKDQFLNPQAQYGLPVTGSIAAILPGENTLSLPQKDGFLENEPLNYYIILPTGCRIDSVVVTYYCTNPNNGVVLDCDGLWHQGGVSIINTLEAFRCNTPTAATCSDGIQNQGEAGIDCGGPCPACPCFLETINLSGRPNRGIMFDVAGLVNVTIDNLDVVLASFAGTSHDVSIYYKSGSFQGYENSPGAWTLAGSTTVNSTGYRQFTNVPINIGQNLNGDTLGVFVLNTNNESLSATGGAVSFTDSVIKIMPGKTMSNFTNHPFSPRIFNGIVNYTSASCGVFRVVDTLFTESPCPRYAIGLNQGWNIIAAPHSGIYPVPDAYSEIEQNVILLKDVTGKAWFPSFELNEIGNTIPGYGYKIKMAASDSLHYK